MGLQKHLAAMRVRGVTAQGVPVFSGKVEKAEEHTTPRRQVSLCLQDSSIHSLIFPGLSSGIVGILCLNFCFLTRIDTESRQTAIRGEGVRELDKKGKGIEEKTMHRHRQQYGD